MFYFTVLEYLELLTCLMQAFLMKRIFFFIFRIYNDKAFIAIRRVPHDVFQKWKKATKKRLNEVYEYYEFFKEGKSIQLTL